MIGLAELRNAVSGVPGLGDGLDCLPISQAFTELHARLGLPAPGDCDLIHESVNLIFSAIQEKFGVAP